VGDFTVKCPVQSVSGAPESPKTTSRVGDLGQTSLEA